MVSTATSSINYLIFNEDYCTVVAYCLLIKTITTLSTKIFNRDAFINAGTTNDNAHKAQSGRGREGRESLFVDTTSDTFLNTCMWILDKIEGDFIQWWS